MATSFKVNVADLEFILRQIKIAEAHSGGLALTEAIKNEYGLSPSDANLAPFGLRTVSGVYNNLAPGQENFGAADTSFPRMLDPQYVNDTDGDFLDFNGNGVADPGEPMQGDYSQPGTVVDADPRTISNLIANQTIDNPAAVAAWFDNPLSLAAFQERHGPDAIPVLPGSLTGQLIPITNADFDLQALADGVLNTTAPAGWTITGITGGTVDLTDAQANPAGHGGENAAWLQTGAALSRVFGETISQSGRYELSLNIGDRSDVPWAGGAARLLATNGVDTVELSTLVLPDPGDGQWANVTLDSGVIPAAVEGYSLMVEIQSEATPFGHVLIDDVELRRFNANEIEIDNIDIANIPNQSPDIGLSPGFNAWMTFFGQFFDHGLDLVTKSDNGVVYIPLEADDPLITHGPDGIPGSGDEVPPHLAFMAVTRAKLDAQGNAENTTTPFVDQNQTYTSHPSHQVFLREYHRSDIGDGAGMVSRSTGALLDSAIANGGVDGAPATWGETKAQALEMLGINLSDFDVHSAPLLKTDDYGEFVPGPNGFAQLIMMPDSAHAMPWLKEGNSDGSVTTEGAYTTGHQFLVDIAHHAVPGEYDPDHNPYTPNSVQQIADFDMRDANGDGASDAADVAALAGVLTDANNDGMIDVADLADVNLDGVIDDADMVADDHNPFTYDNEMLDSHFVTGDGRGNENIALTAVHSVFHSEHNRLLEANKTTLLEAGDLALLNEWLLVDVVAIPTTPAEIEALVWDGERLFQASRFVTEMQYQHLVFEEYARRIQPAVDPFVFTHSPDIDAAIVAEFAHTVYRFGHSMLTDTVDRYDNNLEMLNGGSEQATLIEAFLNPQMFAATGADVGEIIANVVRGATQDVGNEMDEFIVPALQSNLLGLPLDLAAINIARGRENGIPSLNEARKQFYEDYGLADLKPYTSWLDFAQHIKHPASIINFIAAYGTHATITGTDTIDGKREAAWELVTGTKLDGTASALDTADRLDFLNARGTYATAELGGMNQVDFWIGGLAEELNEFGGMLGSTFNLVFEFQMEKLQTGDRFYYLSRTQGTNMLNQLEPNTFTDLVMRNTTLSDEYATHLNGNLFVTPDLILELDRGIAQADPDPTHDDAFQQLIDPKVVRDYSNATAQWSGVGTHDVGGTLKFSGGEHVVLGGTEGNDRLYGDKGIDTLWGDGGDDYLNAGMESDNVFGGEGDDIIEDPFGDDVLRGEGGNDVISAGSGLDLIFGGEGQDYIIVGQDDKEAFGDEGDDFILGGTGNDFLLGGEGNDWIEGGDGFDVIAGENSELFFNSPIVGHDVAWGQSNDQDYDLESGDDIALSGPGIQRFEGMFGFDWASAKYDVTGVDFDFQIPIFTNIPTDILRDRFDQIEAGSGWIYDDVLQGDDRGHVNGGSSSPDSVPVELFTDHVLTAEGIDRIDGLRDLLGGNTTSGGLVAMDAIFGANSATFQNGNILIGGGGSDVLRGRGGYDILDGDAWLNVRIRIVHEGVEYSAESLNTDQNVAGELSGLVFNLDEFGEPDFSSPAFGGRSLNSLMLDGTINPGSLSIVREIKYDDPANTSVDTAVFQGTLAEYDIEGRQVAEDGTVLVQAEDVDDDGFIRIQDRDTGSVGAVVDGVQLNSRGALTDDIDLLRNIEQLQFADQTIVISGNNTLATGTVTISDATPFNGLVTPYVGQVLVPTLSNFADADGIPIDSNTNLPVVLTFEWQTTEIGSNAGWTTIQTSDTYTVRSVDPGHTLRAVAVFKDNNGVTERIYSEPTDNPTAAYNVDENSPSGTVVGLKLPFSLDYDAQPINGQPPADVDLTTLHHEIDPAYSAGGRFTVELNGTDIEGFPRYSLVVDQGGPQLLDYEAPVHTAANQSHQFVDNQYQVVINTYDAPGGELIAVRQFTVLLNDVNEGPSLGRDWVVTNVAQGSPVVIDQSALLANDVDPEGDALSITTLFGPNGVSGLSLTDNPGAVTVTDSGAEGGLFRYRASDGEFTAATRVDLSTQTADGGFSENFNTGGYAQNDGNWIENWVALEPGHGNNITFSTLAGEPDRELHFQNNPGGGETLTRAADLTGATAAMLEFTWQEDGRLAGEDVLVQVYNSVSASWDTVGTLAGGDADGTASFSHTLTADQIGPQSAIRFMVDGAWTSGGMLHIDDLSIGYTRSDLFGNGARSEILIGDAAGSYVRAGRGDDIVLAGSGDDTAVWNVGDGQDMIDGGADTDTFVINGNGQDETFRVYSRVAALAVATLAGAIRADAEIVITRNTDGLEPDADDIVAQLKNVEEIVINTGDGTDMVLPIGDFDPTSLLYNTIRVNGGSEDDTVDISGLESEHRVVLNGNGGNDRIIGGSRPQDVVVDAAGDQEDENETEEDEENEPETPTGADDTPDETSDEVEQEQPEGDQTISGTEANETLIAGGGNDMIFAGGGADNALGGAGADMVFGDAGNDRVFGGDGDDFLSGGLGNDMVFGGEGDDTFVAEVGDGNDSYFGDGVGGGAGNDTLDMSAITANISADLGNGLNGRGSTYSSDSGQDTIWNIENIVTGSGDDVIIASDAVNVIDGGEGNDIFRFNSVAAADGDTLATFSPGDKIDLSGMDANGSTAGHQSFTLVSDSLSEAGQLMVTQEMRGDDAYTVVSGNVSGGAEPDFKISIKGTHELTTSDFNF